MLSSRSIPNPFPATCYFREGQGRFAWSKSEQSIATQSLTAERVMSTSDRRDRKFETNRPQAQRSIPIEARTHGARCPAGVSFDERFCKRTVAFPARTALARGAGFLTLWVVLIGFAPTDLAAGVAAAAVATCDELAPAAAATRRHAADGLAVADSALPLEVRGCRRGRRAPRARSAPAVAPGLCHLSGRVRPGPGPQCVRGDDEPVAGNGALRRRGRGARLPLPRRRATGAGRTR